MLPRPTDSSQRFGDLVFRIKSFLKKHPKVFFFFYYTLGVCTGKNVKEAIKDIPRGLVILNLASGIKKIREDVINVDIFSFPGVKVVADIGALPFSDNYADAVICEASLEHFKNPEKAVKEMYRVLKRGGLIYISTPFIVGFHASPDDYYRWTLPGLREFLKDFEEKEAGVAWGPTYALTSVLREWLAIVLSFNINFLYQILLIFFMVIFAPLNFLDYIFSRYNSAKNIAYGFYFIGIKK